MSETSDRTKRCHECGKLKPASEFSPSNGRKNLDGSPRGLASRCKPCASHRSVSRAIRRRAAGTLPRTCEMCGETPEASLHLDHDHDTGVIRGAICRGCNTGLGSLKDSPTVLASAIRYLHKHGRCLSTDDLASLLHLNTS